MARHPDSIFVSFTSNSQSGSKANIRSYYQTNTKLLEDISVQNRQICSDSGENLADLQNSDGSWVIKPTTDGVINVIDDSNKPPSTDPIVVDDE